MPVILLLAPLLVGLAARSDDRPNVVLVIGDDHGWPHSGFMGDPVAITPHLDALAEEGTVFTNGHVTASICGPSLRTLLAGIHSSRWRAERIAIETWVGDIPRRQEVVHYRTLPRELQQVGYRSWEGGKMWEGTFAQAGFTHGMAETVGGIFSTDGDEFGRTGIQPFRDFLDEIGDAPFFAWFAPKLPHTPFDAPPEIRSLYANQGLRVAEIAYYANVTWLDLVIGELVVELESRGLREDTLIVYVSDNGTDIGQVCGEGRGKGTLYELGFRTPLIFNWPGHVPAGVRRADLVSSEDLFPTILDYAEARQLADRLGTSLRTAIESGEPFEREQMVSWHAACGPQNAGHFVRTRAWRYLSFSLAPREELYAIEDDPFESVDLAPAYPSLRARFREEVAAWRDAIETGPEAMDVTGRLLDPDGGEPIAGVELQLTDGPASFRAETREGGWFRFEQVPRGQYELWNVDGVRDLDWFGWKEPIPVDVPVASLAPYLPLVGQAHRPTTYQNPITEGSAGASPAVLVVDGIHYLFSSATSGADDGMQVPVRRSGNLAEWKLLGDALPALPAWIDPDRPSIRAPAVATLGGHHLLYFSARHVEDGSPRSGRHCIGVVASDSPTFLLDGSADLLAADGPLLCRSDADVFDPTVASTPTRDWLVWVERRDGRPDVMQNQRLASGGIRLEGEARPLLPVGRRWRDRQRWRLASPALVRDPGSKRYVLSYSVPHEPGDAASRWTSCRVSKARPGASEAAQFLRCRPGQHESWLRGTADVWAVGNADFFRDADDALWVTYDASSDLDDGIPTLRIDPLCFDARGAPRSDGPTTGPQPLGKAC